MNYVGKCGSCIYFEDNSGNGYDNHNADYVKGYCTWYRSYYYPDDSCPHYKQKEESSSCYITTMVCEKLGMDDHSEVLETLRSFRNDVLQKDQKYQGILFEYDSVGPKISKCLKREDKSFIKKIYDGFLYPIVLLIKGKKYEEAIQKYIQMTRSLEECYGILGVSEVPKDYDYQKGGHGKMVKSL